MVSTINLGGLVSNGSGGRLSGLVSGLDGDKLITAAVDMKMLPVKRLEDQVTLNNEKIDALSKLKTHYQNLKTATDKLRATPSNTGISSSMLSAKKVILSSNSIANPVNYLDITATSQVDAQIFNIKVDAIAKSKIQQSTAFANTSSSVTDVAGLNINGRFTAGTFQINGTDITLVAGDSLANIAAKINAVSTTTKVSATILQPTVGQYAIQLKSLETGLANAYTITNSLNVLNDIFSQPNTNVQTASDSQFKINDNITVMRSSNTITDFIPGLTIKVYNPSTDAITIDIDYDKKAATDAIVDFVEAYNTFRTYTDEQQAQDGDGRYLDSAKIRRNAFLSSSKFNIGYQLSTSVDSNTNFSQLSDIGIKNFMSSLEVDAEKLVGAVHNNFDKVRKLLEFQNTSTSANFIITERSNNIGNNTTFSINVDVNRAENERAKITYGGTTINATLSPINAADLTAGWMIIGPTGTPFEGFEFKYTGSGNNETTDIVVTHGVMDKIYNVVEGYLEKRYSNSSGSSNDLDAIDIEIAAVIDEVSSAQTKIENKKKAIETFKETLVSKYAALEASVAKSNAILQMLDAQQRAMESR